MADALREPDVLRLKRPAAGTEESAQLLALLFGWHGGLLRLRELSLAGFVLGKRGPRSPQASALALRLAWGGA